MSRVSWVLLVLCGTSVLGAFPNYDSCDSAPVGGRVERYDGGSSCFSYTATRVSDELSFSYLQLFKPPTLPWRYTSLCVDLFLSPYQRPASLRANESVTAVLVAPSYPAEAEGRVAPSETASDFLRLADVTLSLVLTNASVSNWQAIPIDVVVTTPHVFLGVMVGPSRGTVIYRCGTYQSLVYFRRELVDKTVRFYDMTSSDATGVEIRAAGVPYVVTHAEAAIPGWTLCPVAWYEDGETCHCGCGVPDPDCIELGPVSPNCSGAAEVCVDGRCQVNDWDPVARTWCDVKTMEHDGLCSCGCGSTLVDPECAAPYQKPKAGDCRANAVAPVCDVGAGKCVDMWQCDPALYNDSSVCNCCGIEDPDCDVPTSAQVNDCPGSFVCRSGVCMYPKSWKCSLTAYADGHYCDCLCGAYDPDCDVPGTRTENCPPSVSYTCNYLGECIRAGCGNGHADRNVGAVPEECDRGRGCTSDTCLCRVGYNHTVPYSADCAPMCGDGHLVQEEECDGGKYCSRTTCRCETNHTPYSPPQFFCSGCGNSVLDLGEDCDGGAGCDSDCHCQSPYKPTTPHTFECVPPAKSGGGLTGGAIVGIVVGSVVAVIVAAGVVFLVVFLVIRNSRSKEPANDIVMVTLPDDLNVNQPLPIIAQLSGTGSGGGGSMISPTGGLPPAPPSGLAMTMNSSVPPPEPEFVYDKNGQPIGILN